MKVFTRVSLLLILSFILLPVTPLYPGAGNIKFDHITIRQGLSQSSVRDIIQDKKGFMWFATVDGLNRYDGYNFQIHKPDPNNANSISSPFLRALVQDENGLLWIGTNGAGFDRFDPSTGNFTNFRNEPGNSNSLSYNYVWEICRDRDGTLWLGTDGGGMDHFNPQTKKFTHYRHQPGNPNSLSNDRVLTIVQDGQGFIWAGTRRGLNRLNPRNGEIIRYMHDDHDPGSLSGNQIWTVYVDRHDVIWVGSETGGLDRMGKNRRFFTHYRYYPDDDKSLANDSVLCIMEGRQGALWVGTKGGLNKFDRSGGTFTTYRHEPHNPDSLGDDRIYSIFQDRSGVIWLGLESSGVNKFEGNKNEFLHIRKTDTPSSLLIDRSIWALYEDTAGVVWVGTRGSGFTKIDLSANKALHYGNQPDEPDNLIGQYVRVIYEAPSQPGILWIGVDSKGLLKFDKDGGKYTIYQHSPGNPRSLSNNRVYTIYEDRQKRIWVGTRFGGLNLFNRQDETFTHYIPDSNDPGSINNEYIYHIRQDREGVLWVGTFAGGLNRLDPETNKFSAFQHRIDDPASLPSNCILSIYEDRSGTLWLGTGGGGLAKMNPDKKTFTSYISQGKLSGEVIYGILEDDNGNLWLSSNNGIARFTPSTGTFKIYTEKDGLQSNEFNGGSYFRNPKTGNMFFGGINGFNIFHPQRIKDNTHVPPIVITSFLKFNKAVNLGQPISRLKEITLSHRDYVFSFEFASLDFTVPGKNQYAYKMEGLDKNWIHTGSWNRYATYTTLSPGKYTFRVKGSNNDGIWNEEGVSLGITITPPFWQAWWFEILFIIVAFLLIRGIYRYRVSTVFNRARMETELKTAQMAQMSIMPQQSPGIEGFDVAGRCIPAHEVGGDFFDYFWVACKNDCFGIAVGDVSGKAMKAAMPAVMSNGIIYSAASQSDSILEIINHLNQSLHAKTDKCTFTALQMVSINTKTRQMCFINAGLPEPLLKSGGTVTCLTTEGSTFPLGIMQDTNYQEKRASLKSGDLLVFYTDGVTESWNVKGEFYGESRLNLLIKQLKKNKQASTMTAKAIIDHIIADIRRFSKGAKQRDDITLVVVNVL